MTLQRSSFLAFSSSAFFFSSSVSSSLRPSLVTHTSFSVVLFQLLHHVLVNGISHEQHFKPLLLQALQERRVLNSLAALPGDEVDVLLVLLHASHVVLQRRPLFPLRGGVEAQQLSQFLSVL